MGLDVQTKEADEVPKVLPTTQSGRLAELLKAIQMGNECVGVIHLILLDSPDLANLEDWDGLRPIHHAAKLARPHMGKTVAELVRVGADVNALAKGWPPLMYAVVGGTNAAIEALLEAGADHGWQDEQGETALHLAVRMRSYQTCAILLGAGADPEVMNGDGTDPKFLAISTSESIHGLFRPKGG